VAFVQRRCAKCQGTVPARSQTCPNCGAAGVRWKARYRGPNGVEHSKVFDRRTDADRWLTSQESAKIKGEWIDPAAGRIRLEDFAQEWMAGVVHLRPSTRHRYGSLLKVHIEPALGQAPLTTIRPLDVRAFVSGMLEVGLSPTTARHAFVLLSEILRAAQRDGRIARNPAEDVVPPSRHHQEQRFLSAHQVWALAEAIRPRYRALVLTGAYAGLRWGELAGLRVPRLRLLERKINVSESLVEVGSRLLWGPPKTGSRTVTIAAPLAEELGLHLAACPAGPEALVFTGPEGRPLRHPNFYRREWQPALGRARLDPRLRIHDLRHTAVALAIAAGAHPKEIQDLCGHASIATTLGTYGHLFASLHDRLAERLGETFTSSRAAWSRPGPGLGEVVALRREVE
jgi:integrase